MEHLLGIRLFFTFLMSFFFVSQSIACTPPVFKESVSFHNISEAGFRIDWQFSTEAKHYILNYLFRIPEGRTLSQREVVADTPFHVLQKGEIPAQELLHLVADLTAVCETKKSTTVLAQFALKNSDSKCAFDKRGPKLENGYVSWPPVAGSGAYLLCTFKPNEQTLCREIVDTRTDAITEDIRLISVAPICNGTGGFPVFIALPEIPTKKFR